MIRLLHRRWRHRQGRCRCREQLRQLRLLVLDVDGVLTDGGLWTTETGEVLKRFDVRDGLGIRLLQQAIAQAGVTISLVAESDIRKAMKDLFDTQALVIEPSSAVALAHVAAHAAELEEPIAVVLTGENILRDEHRRLISLSSAP